MLVITGLPTIPDRYGICDGVELFSDACNHRMGMLLIDTCDRILLGDLEGNSICQSPNSITKSSEADEWRSSTISYLSDADNSRYNKHNKYTAYLVHTLVEMLTSLQFCDAEDLNS